MTTNTPRSSLELLYNVSRELASALDLRTVLQRVLFQSLKYVGGERGSIVVLDDGGRAVDAAIVYGRHVQEHTTQQLRETMERGLAGWVVRHRQPAWVPDTSRDARWLRRPDDAVDQSGAKAAMCVPLLARERLVGVLTLVHPRTSAYSKDHFSLMQSIADQAGIAVLNARLYAESQRQARVMTALAGGAATINASLRLEEVLERILEETSQALQVETVALALAESGGDLVFQAASGKCCTGIVGKRVPAGRGLVGYAQREGRGVIIPVVREDRHFLPEVEQFPGLDAFAIACAPIFAQGRAIGVLEAINPLAGSFDPDALLVLAGIGNLAGSAIQHAQLFERLQVAHKRYRELFDDSIDPILVTDWDGKIVESNRQAAVCSGYPSAQLRGMTIEDLGAVLRSEQGACLERLKAGETCSYESSLKTRTGARLPIYVYVRRAAFEDVDTLQWTLRDIRERKELDNLREDLISMIYHDVRSPLANIVSSLDMLAAMFPEDQGDSARPVLDIARRAAERIQRLINSLLDISRLESGQAIVSQQAVLPGMLAKEAAESVQPLVDSRGQTLALALPDRLPLVWIDPDMIRRVLINLLENAAKFTPAGGKMEIGARRKGEWVEIWVQDTGPGIPLQDQEHIFEKFTRLKQEEYKSGTGVGLAFCRLAVHGHGGKIWVENRPAGGARFLLTLPVARG